MIDGARKILCIRVSLAKSGGQGWADWARICLSAAGRFTADEREGCGGGLHIGPGYCGATECRLVYQMLFWRVVPHEFSGWRLRVPVGPFWRVGLTVNLRRLCTLPLPSRLVGSYPLSHVPLRIHDTPQAGQLPASGSVPRRIATLPWMKSS